MLHSLTSLVYSDYKVDEWTQLWLVSITIRLLCLHIQGPCSVPIEQSHASVLVIHRLVYASPLAEVLIKYALLQDKRDWVFIVESQNLSTL